MQPKLAKYFKGCDFLGDDRSYYLVKYSRYIKVCFIIFLKGFVAFQPQFIRHFSLKLPPFYSQFCLTLKLSILKFQINNTPEASQK